MRLHAGARDHLWPSLASPTYYATTRSALLPLSLPTIVLGSIYIYLPQARLAAPITLQAIADRGEGLARRGGKEKKRREPRAK